MTTPDREQALGGWREPVAVKFRVTLPWRKAGCEAWRVGEAERRFLSGEYDALEVRYSDGQTVTHTHAPDDDAPNTVSTNEVRDE